MLKRQLPQDDCHETGKSYKSLLDAAQDGPSISNQDSVLKDAIFQLISHHEDLDHLVQEGVKEFPCIPQEECFGPIIDRTGMLQETVSSLSKVIQEQSLRSGSGGPAAAANICASKLKELLSSDKNSRGGLLQSAELRTKVGVVMEVIQDLLQQQAISRVAFIKAANKDCTLPLELVWRLHTASIMPLHMYITCNLSRPVVIGGLAESVVRLCTTSVVTDIPLVEQIISDVMVYLVNQGHADRPDDDNASRGLRKVSMVLLDSITKKLMSEKYPQMPCVCIFQCLVSRVSELGVDTLKRYSTRQLSLIMSLNPVLKVSQALMQQIQWTYARLPALSQSAYTQLLLALEGREVVDIVREVLEQQEVSWQAVLGLTATFLVNFKQAPSMISNFVNELLEHSLENCELDGIITAFLLVRQACLEGPHAFPTYQEWFQEKFGDANKTPAASRKSFSFLIKFLSEIVPYESVACLKAHIATPPHVPSKCRPLLVDYIHLAKTRLADLKVPVEETGIFEDTGGQSKGQGFEKATQDVEKAVSAFEKTSKVPSSIMEASIFRKPYYIGRFLPALLKPRPLPDNADSTMKLIEALHKADKIPVSLYKSYEEGCKKEATILLEGVFVDEDSMDDLILDPMDQLDQALKHLPKVVLQDATDTPPKCTGIRGQLSVISEKITYVLESATSATGSESHPLPVQVKVIDSVLTTFCQVNAAVSTLAQPRDDWSSQYVSMLGGHAHILPSLCSRVQALLCQQGRELSDVHVDGLALFLCQAAELQGRSANLEIHLGDNCTGFSWPEKVLAEVPYYSGAWMLFSLRLLARYIQHNIQRTTNTEDNDLHIPKVAVQRFAYLVPRLYGEARHWLTPSARFAGVVAEDQFILELYWSSECQHQMKQYKLSLADWLSLELCVRAYQDQLHDLDRQDYYRWVVEQWFLPLPQEQGGCGGSLRYACTAVFNGIMDWDSRTALVEAPHRGCRLPAPEEQSRGTTRHQMVLLLQNLTVSACGECSTRNDAEGIATLPWLHQVLQERMARIPSEDKFTHELELTNFFRLSMLLHPALLYTDDLQGQCHGDDLGGQGHIDSIQWGPIVNCVNHYMRNHCSEGGSLSHGCTLYILKGLKFLSGRYKMNEMIGVLLEKCPLVSASIMHHWKSLSPVWQTWQSLLDIQSVVTPGGLSLKQITNLYKWAERALQDQGQVTMELNGSSWLAGIALHTVSSDRCVSLQKKMDTMSALQKLGDPDTITEVSQGWLCGLLCDWSQATWQQKSESDLLQVAGALVERCPSSLLGWIPVFMSKDVARKLSDALRSLALIPSEVVLKQFAVAVMRVLIQLERPQCLAMFRDDKLPLECLLQLHICCVELYHDTDAMSDMAGSDIKHIGTVHYQPLDVQFMIQGAQLVKNIIMTLPKQNVQNINKDILSRCDPDVQTAVRLQL